MSRPEPPPEWFAPVTATLEDAYLVLMRGEEPAASAVDPLVTEVAR